MVELTPRQLVRLIRHSSHTLVILEYVTVTHRHALFCRHSVYNMAYNFRAGGRVTFAELLFITLSETLRCNFTYNEHVDRSSVVVN